MEKRKVEQAVTGTNGGVLRKEDLVPEQLVSEEYFISTRLPFKRIGFTPESRNLQDSAEQGSNRSYHGNLYNFSRPQPSRFEGCNSGTFQWKSFFKQQILYRVLRARKLVIESDLRIRSDLFGGMSTFRWITKRTGYIISLENS